jgi:molecular chaperone HscB
MDAFDVLGLAPVLDLDPKLLEQRYRDLQRALHPDKFAQSSASERRASLSHAVSVNDAYRKLRDDLCRAEVLFARHGGDASESAKRADPALLMEIMELREQLSDARGGAAGAERERLAVLVREQQTTALSELRRAFAELTTGHSQALEVAGRALMRLRYYRRFLDEVAALEEALD